MLERIGFRVIHASSEDPRYLASELEKHGPGANGWRSMKGTGFPQEVILQLESRSRLGHMQLLAHQYAIPESIELFIGDYGEDEKEEDAEKESKCQSVDLNKVQFVYLGQVIMSTNQSTGFKAREMKSITVKCVGAFVKLLINKVYRNKYNRDQQIALVAINLLGEKLEEDFEMTKSCTQITFEETSERDRNLFSPYDDLSFTMYVDNEVQDFIRKLDLKKQEAVLDERFDYASKLKTSMEKLKKTGELLAKYQLEKQIAASREDFEKAKEKKTQMDSLRESTYKSLRVKELLEPNGRIVENDETGQVLGGIPVAMTQSIMSLAPTEPMSVASTPESTTSGRFSQLTTPDPDHEKRESGYFSVDEPKLPPVFLKKRKPLMAKVMSNNLEKERDRELPPARDEPPANAPCNACINRPSSMSERARRYAALPIQVFGDQLVEKIFSKSFQVKEDGLRCLHKTLSDYKRGDKNNPPSKVFRAASLLLQRTIKDTIFGVFHLTTEALVYVFDEFARKHRLVPSEMAQGLERMLPELLSKSGDPALGKNKVAIECILKLQACQHLRSLHVISSHLTKPFDTPVHPRLAQSKTEMVEELLKTYGISTEKNSGLTARDYAEFGASAFNQPSESIRRVAERILINLYSTHPKLVRQNLPLEDDVSKRNMQYRQLFQSLDKIDKERKDGTSALKDVKNSQSMTASVYIPKM